MNRKVLVTLLWKEIRDLELITEGFLIMTEYPEEIVQLVIEKTESIQSYIQQLGQFKSEVTEFSSIDTSAIDSTMETPVITEQLNTAIDLETENDSVEETKAASFIVTSNQEVSLDDHFVELEEELYSNHEETEEVLETVVEVAEEVVVAEEVAIANEVTIANEVAVAEAIVPEVETIESPQIENDIRISAVERLIVEEELTQPHVAPQEALINSLEAEEETVLPTEEVVVAEAAQPRIEEIPPVSEVVSETSNEIETPAVAAVQKSTDIKQSMSLGDRFRFQRDLFKGNGEDMNKTIKYLNQLNTVNEAISFLEKKYKWEADDESAVDFYQIVKRRFL
jgi:hypothetical protein